MSFFHKIKQVVHTEGVRGIRHVLQKEGTKRLAQDLSANLDVEGLSFCETRRYGLPAHISSIAVDPVQGLLACGTFKGAIAVTGAPDVAGYLELSEAVSVKMMVFQPGAPILVVIDAKNTITVFDLIKRKHIFVRSARNIVTCMELLSGSNWLFHGLKDGTIDVFDIYKGQAVSYRIPNLLPEGKKHSLVVSIKTHPTDNNQLLIAFNTGVVLWNLKHKTVMHTYVFEIPPGAMGGVAPGHGMQMMNESRYPHVTVIAWKPDGDGFVSGYDDGCIVFWDVKQERPIMARTIYEVKVNVPGVKPIYDRDVSQSMPIYQLAWCLLENKQDSALIVAGGANQPGMYGLNVFDFPHKPDYSCPRRHHTVTTESDILDFTVIPRDSPWYNGALDPVSIVVLTNHGGIQSFSFDATHAPQTIPSTLLFAEPSLVLSKTYGQLPQEIFDRLVYGLNSSRSTVRPYRMPLRGVRLAQCDESRLCRDILVTAHSDLSIRFWEGASFRPLHHLTVEFRQFFFNSHGEIAFMEFSVFSQVLVVGFSNGNWIYCKLSWDGHLSRQSSVAGTICEDPANEVLATDFQKTVQIGNNDGRVESGGQYSVPGQAAQSCPPIQPLTNDARETPPPLPPYNVQDRHNAPPLAHHIQDQQHIQGQCNTAPIPQNTQDQNYSVLIPQNVQVQNAPSMPQNTQGQRNAPLPQGQHNAPPMPQGQHNVPPMPQGQHNVPPMPQGQHNVPPMPQGQHNVPPMPQGQHNVPPMPQGQHNVPPMPQGQHNVPPMPQGQHNVPPMPQGQHNAPLMPQNTESQYTTSSEPHHAQDHHDNHRAPSLETPTISIQPPNSNFDERPALPVRNQYQQSEGPGQGSPHPERTPSPSLPPRPEFVELPLPNGLEFLSAFKSSTHMGRINQVAVSGCGLVAVSDELYSLSITDTVTGKLLHIEDLKVVMLDRDKGHGDSTPAQGEAHPTHIDTRSTNSETRSTLSDARSTFSDGRSVYSDSRSSHLDADISSHVRVEPQALQRVGIVITSLEFVISTTSDQEKIPLLLLVAGSSDGIYMIFSISSADSHPMLPQRRQVKKVETYQTKERFLSIHTSIVDVISPSENNPNTTARSNASFSSASSVATDSTSPSQSDSLSHQATSPSPPPQYSEDGLGKTVSRQSSVSESSSTLKPSVYSTWKEAQGKLMTKAQQRLQYFISVSEFSLRVHMNCTSRRIHKTDLTQVGENEQDSRELASRTGRIMAANVVYHGDAACILCLTESGRIILFSIPKLELIPLPVPNGELYLPILLEPERLRESTILSDGRIYVPILKYEYRMYSLWGHDRWIQTPQGFVQERFAESSSYVQLYDHGIQIPPRPHTHTTPGTVAGWFGLGGLSETPSQKDLDELLGGSNYRPENPILKRAGFEEHPRGPDGRIYGDETTAGSGIKSVLGDTMQGLNERGDKLRDLKNKTEDMNAASSNFLAAAKALNDKNANKKWYEF